jgi:membrane-associated phospholipid phosphatase
MRAMSGSARTAVLSLVAVACLSGRAVQAQTFDFGAPIPSAADSRFSAQPQGAPSLSSTSTVKAPTPNFFKATLTDFRNLSTSKSTLTWLAVGTVASTFTRPVDVRVTREMSTTPAMEQLRAGNIIGGKEFQFSASLAALTIGKISGNARVSDVAGKVLRAQIMAQTVTGVMKKAAQRQRPDGSDSRSFPSGHTSVSFASATVLQRELGWKVGAPAYAAASYVAMARIEKKKHFLSDVAFGAAIGILSGRTVTIGSGEKRFAVSPVAMPGGAAINFSLVGNKAP